MSDYKVTDSELTGIANAIRTKGGTSSPLVFPNGFTSAIDAIPAGGGVVQPLSVIQNGIYTPPSGVDGYSPVTVNVSGGGSTVAIVTVTYPAGSVVTATDGTTTLTSNTSGEYDFYLPNGGAWTFIGSSNTKILDIQTSYKLSFNYNIIRSVWWRGTGELSITGDSTIHVENLYGNYQLVIISINGEASDYQLTPTAVHVVEGIEESVALTNLLYQGYKVGRTGNTRNLRFSIGEVNLTGDDYIETRIAEVGGNTITIAMLLPRSIVTQVNEVRSSDGTQIQTAFDSSSNVSGVIYGFINGSSSTKMANYYCDSYSVGDTVDTGSGPSSYGAGFIFGVS